MTQKANYITIAYEDEYYDENNITVYDYIDNPEVKDVYGVLKTEIEFMETHESDHEIHIYKLVKIIKPKRTVYETLVEDVVIDTPIVSTTTAEPEIEI
jgi:hypothetical protein